VEVLSFLLRIQVLGVRYELPGPVLAFVSTLAVAIVHTPSRRQSITPWLRRFGE